MFVAPESATWAAPPPPGGETVTYTYDPLGRLVGISRSGTVNNGQNTTIDYDPAGNRSGVVVTGVGTPNQPTPSPTPIPVPPPNQSPIAVNDVGSQNRCGPNTYSVLSNDSDPDGHVPLALVGVSGGSGRGTPSFTGTLLKFTPNGMPGTAVVNYTMRDSLGATASATLTITLTGIVLCPR